MEYSKKDKILDTAMDLFRKKGFSAASMQDIAEACGVAKASIYKFYPSKEDLFTVAFVACHQTLLEQASELDRSGMPPGLSPKEKLSRKIEFYLYYILENHSFMIDFHELPIMENEPFMEAQKKMKIAVLTWRKEMLIETFGERLEPYAWDAVLIFRGILHEYMNGVLRKVISLPIAELADFIVDRMDAIVQDLIRTAPKSIVGERIVSSNPLDRSDEAARKGTVRDFLAAMEERIQTLPLSEASRMELRDVVGLLRKEVLSEKPNLTLLRVLKAHLEAVPELRSYLRQLKLLLT
ncbi:AcrR family transcriptional regulator [Paenibacillus sp. V4I9]|uniref:TetR/AcrR family transcriptional regulator n=1 Tax=Paenibacillus sp. V4I9 TaxID=3042308 RepID=UPI00278367E1|nr:TetR/AcrR family transcriptional regulator [Paenibacillus sp. V4I9]MDQ0886641.1 AcrR family transcriptional regulator [Paenibacillus sp. V4I9]